MKNNISIVDSGIIARVDLRLLLLLVRQRLIHNRRFALDVFILESQEITSQRSYKRLARKVVLLGIIAMISAKYDASVDIMPFYLAPPITAINEQCMH